jgi:dynein heavy chain 2, cytosolic
MIHFSNNAVDSIKKGKLSNYKTDLMNQLQKYTTFNHNGDTLLLLKVKALIIDILHNIDVMDQLLTDGICTSMNPNDWMWFKQLRYRIEMRDNQCMVGMCDAFFDYTYEY